MKIDIEEIEKKILAIIQSKLPAKLIEINTEKGDSLLANIDNSTYVNNLYQAEINNSLFVFYGIKDSVTKDNGSDFSQEWTLFYNVLIQDMNQLATVRSKIIRYSRAFSEVIKENITEISRYCSIPEIANIAPQDVTDINNNTPYKMGGIEIKIVFS